ncbi:MAG: dihydropteroate synthase [Armatimonadota bacterium]|nr:dihydropteroate synthase [Armatimonadota bacterium]
MTTVRLLVLDHADDRREIAARFGVPETALTASALLVSDLASDQAADAVGRLAAAGLTVATAPVRPSDGVRDLLLAGPRDRLVAASRHLPDPLASVVDTALERATAPVPPLVAGPHRLPMDGRPLIVGILNATPDSFYDGGRYFGLEQTVARAEAMIAEGVDVIEVGGETARPSVPVIAAHEEIDRVCPVIRAVRHRFAGPIGVDTYKPEVARAALDAGAVICNDISGLADERMALVAAEAGAALVITHIRVRPKVADPWAQYERVTDEVYAFLAERVRRAEALGVSRQSLIIDPGLSFGKQVAHDLTVVRRLREFRGLGLPIYLAASRKNFIRDVMGLPFSELLEGTMAVVAYGVLAGANLIRTHDVQAVRRLVTMLHAILAPTPPVVAEGAPRETGATVAQGGEA